MITSGYKINEFCRFLSACDSEYRRLWSEEPNCIANTSLLAIGTAYALNCEKTYNYKQVKNMKRADRCQ